MQLFLPQRLGPRNIPRLKTCLNVVSTYTVATMGYLWTLRFVWRWSFLLQYVFLVATLMNSLGAILSPVFSSLDFSALIVVRIVQGLGGVSSWQLCTRSSFILVCLLCIFNGGWIYTYCCAENMAFSFRKGFSNFLFYLNIMSRKLFIFSMGCYLWAFSYMERLNPFTKDEFYFPYKAAHSSPTETHPLRKVLILPGAPQSSLLWIGVYFVRLRRHTELLSYIVPVGRA